MDVKYGDMGDRRKMLDIKYILEVLTIAFPPPGKARHNFTINDEGYLELCLMIENRYYPFALENGDFDTSPKDLTSHIITYMRLTYPELNR